MPVRAKSQAPAYHFVDPKTLSDELGVCAVGGPINADRLLTAYHQGIFPWSGTPVQWCCPDPRAVFMEVRLPRKLGKMIRRGNFSLSFDMAFRDVVTACAEAHADREGEGGTWITPEFIDGYNALHRRGYAHSVEIWQGDSLVGGLYGVQLGGLFSGESMFHRVSDASKVAFAALVYQLRAIGIVLLDGQVINLHTYRLGAVQVPRKDYLDVLPNVIAAEVKFNGKVWPREGPAAALGLPTVEMPLRPMSS